MNRWALIAAAAACVIAGDVAAQPAKLMGEPASTSAFALFSEFCVAHEGDYDGLVAALRARRFDEFDDKVRSSEGGLNGRGFTTRVKGAEYRITAAQLSIATRDRSPDSVICIVASDATEAASQAAARAWVGVPMAGQPGGQELYMYRQTATGRVPLRSMESLEARAAMRAGEYRQFNIAVDDRGAELFFLSQ